MLLQLKFHCYYDAGGPGLDSKIPSSAVAFVAQPYKELRWGFISRSIGLGRTIGIQ